MNNAQLQSIIRTLLSGLSGGILAWTASKSPGVKDAGSFFAVYVTGPDVIAALTLGVTWLWGHVKLAAPRNGNSPNFSRPVNLLLALILPALLFTGCADFKEASKTNHDLVHRSALLPPGWTLAGACVTNTASGNQFFYVTVIAPGTNANTGFFASIFAPRPRVFTDFTEEWNDTSKGGGTFVFTDPSASQALFSHTNQAALGGSRATSIGSLSSVVTTNDVAALNAATSAAAQVAAAVVTAVTGSPGAVVSKAAAAVPAATAAVPSVAVPASVSSLSTNL